jgi:hypothetical protein
MDALQRPGAGDGCAGDCENAAGDRDYDSHRGAKGN